MRNKERGDVIGISHCTNCKEETERQYFGFVPHYMLNTGPKTSWYEAQICVDCGSLTPLNILEDDVSDIEEDYVDFLIDHGIINKNQREKWLGDNTEDTDGS